ncbi:MAG: type II toxin-antitoxin system PemK/MazF family toxin [Planctomycetaceae bacterium]|nr:type II toxin-antitoxin system PemK/MazF family toxin [Planctomycetaceae bacterium]
MIRRGDVIMIDLPFADGSGSKVRPVLVVANDQDNRRLNSTVVAMITGNIQHADEPTQVLIDPQTAAEKACGLTGASVVKCQILFTVAQSKVIRHLGCVSSDALKKVDQALKAALSLS